LFPLHKLGRPSWEEFCACGRGKRAERALHRVGGYYDRVGNLVKHSLIHKEEILPTIGGYAVAVWYRIEPLVKELRLRENAMLFENYESLLPKCHECYVPGLDYFRDAGEAAAADAAIKDLSCAIPGLANNRSLPTGGSAAPLSSAYDDTVGERSAMVPENMTTNGQTLMAPDFALPDSDGVPHRLSEFAASGAAVVVYARNAWCPFCLRQLADYGERYGDFKRAGIEVAALSPESQRKSRRLRTTLKLPCPVLSDAKFEAARTFGLMNHEKPGLPTPATLMLESELRVVLSSLNASTKALVAREVLDYARAVKSGAKNMISLPQPEQHKPGWLFVRGLANLAVGLVSR
jgi:peroxiredoxin Q/BCP